MTDDEEFRETVRSVLRNDRGLCQHHYPLVICRIAYIIAEKAAFLHWIVRVAYVHTLMERLKEVDPNYYLLFCTDAVRGFVPQEELH